MVGSVAEILPADEDEADLPEAGKPKGGEDDDIILVLLGSGSAISTLQRKEKKEKKSMVVKTTTRQTIYLPIIGLVMALYLQYGGLF